jgi:hypothetical protein
MQRDHRYWNDVNVDQALFLPVPRVILLEDLTPEKGSALARRNGDGGPMTLYYERYEHGVGMRAGNSAVYRAAECANTFRAMVGIDDAEASAGQAQLIARVDGKEVWRSRRLKKYERELAHFRVVGGQPVVLSVTGSSPVLANWGGAKFTCNDPEVAR